MIQITISTLTLILGAISILGTIFAVYLYFRNPQIASEKETVTLKQNIVNLETQVKEIKETHLRALENEIKTLNSNVNTLSGTVIKLATIIDERIPKGTANLTPPGV